MTTNSPAVAVPPKLMTADEFWDFVHLPENENKLLELVRGEVIEMPSPMKIHGVVCGNIARLLGNYSFEVGKGYITTNDSGVILERDPDTVRGPDVAYYTDAEAYSDLHPKWGETPPILAVEVLSPSDKWHKVAQKIATYLDSGVLIVWLVDTEEQFVTVYRLHHSPQVLDRHQELAPEELPGFRSRVGTFFRLPGDKPIPPSV